jgi:ribosomal protein L24
MNLLIRSSLFRPFTSLLLSNPIKYPFAILEAKPNKKPQVPFKKWNIVRGDIVKIIAGKDRTKIGKVSRVWRKNNKITVKGVNIKIKRVSKYFIIIKKIHKVEKLLEKENHILFMSLMQGSMIVKLKRLLESGMDIILKLVKS